MAKRLVEKKIRYFETLLSETRGCRRLLIKLWIWQERRKLKKYKTCYSNTESDWK
jgi:hypothetical protein